MKSIRSVFKKVKKDVKLSPFQKRNINVWQKDTEILDISNISKKVFEALHSEQKINDQQKTLKKLPLSNSLHSSVS